MIVKQRICDLCGRPTHGYSGSLIVKKRWFVFPDHGWSKCDICADCANKIKEEVNNAKHDKRRESTD